MDRFQCFGAGIPKLGVAGTFFMSRVAEVKTKIASRQCKTSTTGATTIDKYIQVFHNKKNPSIYTENVFQICAWVTDVGLILKCQVADKNPDNRWFIKVEAASRRRRRKENCSSLFSSSSREKCSVLFFILFSSSFISFLIQVFPSFKLGRAGSSQVLIPTHQPSRGHVPEYSCPNIDRHEQRSLITNVFRSRRCTSEKTLTSVATQSGEQQHRGPAADVVPLPCLLAWAVPVCPPPTVGKYWQTWPQNFLTDLSVPHSWEVQVIQHQSINQSPYLFTWSLDLIWNADCPHVSFICLSSTNRSCERKRFGLINKQT